MLHAVASEKRLNVWQISGVGLWVAPKNHGLLCCSGGGGEEGMFVRGGGLMLFLSCL